MRTKMRTKKVLAAIALTIMFLFASKEGHAITLGLPDINFDTVPGGALNYNAATGDLSVSATLIALTMPGPVTTNPGGTVNYTMNWVSTSSTAGTTTGYFGNSSLANDLVIVDGSSTTLLTGEFVSANMSGFNGGNLGYGSAVFNVTGGSLAGAFTTAYGGMVNLDFNLSTNFSSTMFAGNFSGDSKGDIAPVPEPSTVLLLGSGLVGIGLWFRRRAKD